MAEQTYYEDVEVGSEITPLKKVATTRMLVQWAGASGDFTLCTMKKISRKTLASAIQLFTGRSRGHGS